MRERSEEHSTASDCRKRRWIFCLLCLTAAVLTVLTCYVTVIRDTRLFVGFLDVGQGDAAYICTPDGYRLLLDGGERGNFESIRSFLAHYGAPALDAAIISHYHSDHAGGILDALEEGFPIKRLYLPNTDNDSVLHGALLEAAEHNGTEVSYLSGGDTVAVGEQAVFHVILPDHRIYPTDSENENNNSMLMKLSFGETDILFTGDLEAEAEAALPQKIDLNAEVLKVAHHGSDTSTSEEFLERVAPDFAVIEVGAGNRYGHPALGVMHRLGSRVAYIYRTDLFGSVIFRAENNGRIEVETTR